MLMNRKCDEVTLVTEQLYFEDDIPTVIHLRGGAPVFQTGNRLLDSLSPPLRSELCCSARSVELPQQASLLVAGQLPAVLLFLTRGAASSVVKMSNGSSAEVAMTGVEGLVGACTLLGPLPASSESFMQVPGTGVAVDTAVLSRLFLDSAELRCRILQYIQAQSVVAGQHCACSRLHEAEARLARWLLTASDISATEELPLTQEFLAQMLGSQRTTVALVAGNLQRAGHITYSRGKVRIQDRDSLTLAACECYEVVRKTLQGLYPAA